MKEQYRFKTTDKIAVAIETSDVYLGLSLHAFGPRHATPVCLKSLFQKCRERQSDALIPSLDRMLKSLQIKKENLQLVAVDVGPGSFTGLRVGVTTARTIGQVLNIPLVGVNRLEAMAAKELKRDPAACVVPTVPALPGEIYFGVYRGNDVLHPPAWVRMEEFKERLKRFEAWHSTVIDGTQPPHPRVIGELAIRKYLTHLFGQSKGGRPGSSKNPFHYKNTMPLYLQPSWAERTALAKR